MAQSIILISLFKIDMLQLNVQEQFKLNVNLLEIGRAFKPLKVLN